MSDPLEVVEAQAQIISMQSETINELFQLLMQYMAVEEVNRLPCVERLNRARVKQPEEAASTETP